MSKEREAEKLVSRRSFISTLRRVADRLEQGEPLRIQVKGRRFVVPADAELVVEHEVEGDHQELSFELLWKSGEQEAEAQQASRQTSRQTSRGARKGGASERPEPASAEASEPEEADEEEEEEEEDEAEELREDDRRRARGARASRSRAGR